MARLLHGAAAMDTRTAENLIGLALMLGSVLLYFTVRALRYRGERAAGG